MHRRGFLLAAGAALVLPRVAFAERVAAAPATLAELLRAFHGMPGLEAAFEEEKHVAVLRTPLVQRGTFFFHPPSTLLKRTEGARAEDVIVTSTRVVRRQRGREEVLDLRARPDVRPLVESMLWIFSGNLPELERTYTVTYARSAARDAYSLALVPRTAPLNQIVASMTLRGVGYAVTEVELRESNGNRTVTRILRSNPARTFSATEQRSLFGVTR